MNEHLRPVFKIVLPKIEQAGIDYWAYGGISIAGFNRGFFRINKDLDIFLVDTDFKRVKSIIDELCQQNNFELINHKQKTKNERLKIEIKIDNIGRFSAIPVYKRSGIILFKYSDGDQEYPNNILEKIERNISGSRFFTPRDEFIKKMFIAHIKARPDKKERKNIVEDARHILSKNEFEKHFPNQSHNSS